MSDTAKPETPAAKAPESEADRRLRERVEKLVVRDAAVSSGSCRLANGTTLDYTAHVAFLPVVDGNLAGAGAPPQAAVMTTAYLAKGVAAAARPVCFAFNGGPGSASVWLHLGALGPKRVIVPDDGSMPRAPYAVSDNPLTWLEHFDLVFIDPPHTGWSVCASEAARKKMLSVDGDVEALSEVMRLWLTRHQRWGSAVYLAGESYGTTRGAALANKLAEMGIPPSGVVLVSCAMDLQTLVFSPGNDLPYALFLPAMANVSQYHGLLKGPLGASSAAAREAAEAYVPEYLAALHAGARLSTVQRGKVAARLAELTGLPQALVEEKNLRIADHVYFFEAMRDKGLQVGRLDARVTGPMAAHRTREWEFDPGIESIEGPYTMAAMDYFGRTLGLQIEERYQVLNREVNMGWTWMRGGDGPKGDKMGFASTSGDLARALRRNAHLKVLAASGRYDLGTPYSASDWSLAQLDAPADVLARVQHRYYDAGHMMYTRQADLAQLKADLAAWLG
ncbi:MAG: peptidase S10 [Rubrivivax sp.]|nr:peptidase S10 [Rubrivivax sp.]